MHINEIKYGDISSGAFGLTFGTEVHSILPPMRKNTRELISRDGEVDFGFNGYTSRIITLPCYYDGDFSDLRKNREAIMMWLSSPTAKKLILGTEPDKYYLAKIYAGLEFENSRDGYIGDVQFECNPPWQFYFDGTILTPDQLKFCNCYRGKNQFIKELSKNDVIKLFNKGAEVKPRIKLYGTFKDNLCIECGKDYLLFSGLKGIDGIEIDCERETVKRISDGANLSQYIQYGSNFITLPRMTASLNISQTGINVWPESLTVIVEFDAREGIINV